MTGSGDQTVGPSVRVPRAPPVLFGREHERALLSEVLSAASNGDGRLVLLSGEAGIGKTSLARDLVRGAEGQNLRVFVGHCFEVSSAPPYGPWLEIFRKHRGESTPAAFRHGQLGPVRDQAALFTEVREYFERVAADRPILLLLEDLHWADPASIELLRSLTPALAGMPILVIATYRQDELPRGHPLAQLLPALVREGNALRLDLKRLDSRAVLQMIEGQYRLSDGDAARLAAYLEHHADGNPFFVVELLRALEEEGLLRAGKDRAQLGELARIVVPSLLQQVIDSRVARTGEAIRRPLEIAAVIGQEVPLALWGGLANLEEDQLLVIVERAIDAHLIEAMRNGTHIRFVHALTREAIYEGIVPPRRRLWHQSIAETLASERDPNPDSVALHFQSAGDIRAVHWLQRAADQAQSAYAWLTAAVLLRSAAGIIERAEGQGSDYRRIIMRIAYLLRFSYPAEAAELLQEAEQLAVRSGDQVASVLIWYLRGILLCYSDRFRAGTERFVTKREAFLALAIDEKQETTLIETTMSNIIAEAPSIERSTILFLERELRAAGFHALSGGDFLMVAAAGQTLRAIEQEERFLATLSTLPSIPLVTGAMRAFALHGLGVATAALGRPDDADRYWQESRELFGEVGHHTLVAFTLICQIRDLELTWRANHPAFRRQRAAEASAALARAGGSLRPGVSPRLALLGCFVIDGRWKEADDILRDLPDPGNTFLRREETITIVFLARQRAEPQRAWDKIHTVLSEGERTEPGDIFLSEGLFLHRLAAELCLDEGDLSRARIWLEAHDRWLAWGSATLGHAEGRLAWASWHQAAGNAEAAAECAERALVLASEPDQPLVQLGAHRLLGQLETAAGNTSSAASHLARSLELATACDAPFERARTQLALAQMMRIQGEREAASALLVEVEAIAEHLDARLLRSQVQRVRRESVALESFMGLTSRETQILRLLATRRTNAEIAGELFISRRTVTTHVEHIFSKLGIRSRNEAEQIARDSGLI